MSWSWIVVWESRRRRSCLPVVRGDLIFGCENGGGVMTTPSQDLCLCLCLFLCLGHRRLCCVHFCCGDVSRGEDRPYRRPCPWAWLTMPEECVKPRCFVQRRCGCVIFPQASSKKLRRVTQGPRLEERLVEGREYGATDLSWYDRER